MAQTSKEKDLTLIALFAALIAILGLIPAVGLSFGVPITAQSLGVMLCGTVLGARRGALAVVLFLAVTLLGGLPLLAGGRGGLGVLTSPTVGFVIGFPFAAFVAGWVVQRTTLPLGLAAGAGAVIGGIGVLYIFGLSGMAWVLGKSIPEAAFLTGAFLPGDIIKAVLAGFVTVSIARMRPSSVLSRA